MDGFELDVDQAGLDQCRNLRGVIVQEGFEIPHGRLHQVWRRRDIERIAGAATANPILAAAKFTGILLRSSGLDEQDAVDLADQAQGQWETIPKSGQAVVHGLDIARDFADIVQGSAWRLGVLVEQEIGKRRLGALDLGRQQGLENRAYGAPANLGA